MIAKIRNYLSHQSTPLFNICVRCMFLALFYFICGFLELP